MKLSEYMDAKELGNAKLTLCKRRIESIQKEISLHERQILKLQEQELEQWTEIVRIEGLLKEYREGE